MFWETKLLELQKLAPVDLTQTAENEWTATMKAGVNQPFHKDSGLLIRGETRAKAVVDMWSHIVNGHDPFLIFTQGHSKKIRWNARWEVLEEINEPTELVVEELELNDFDQAD